LPRGDDWNHWPHRSEREWEHTQEWLDDLADELADAYADFRPQDAAVLRWLEDLAASLSAAGIDSREERRIRSWIDDIRESVESARRAARDARERELRAWLESTLQQLMPGGAVDDASRRAIERELRGSVRGLQLRSRIAAAPTDPLFQQFAGR
jgi:hypothetical protein